MANCIDCFHFEICQYNEQEQAAINLKSSYRDISNDIADGCRFFQNKSDFVEVKHGKWRLETDEEMPDFMFKLVVCSVCGSKSNQMYYYCPCCGVKMDLKGGADNG